MVAARKLSRLQKFLLLEALAKRSALADPKALLMFAEITTAAGHRHSENGVNASLSRACRRLRERGLVLVVHRPAITRAERYQLKQSSRRRGTNYRSWQAGISLTAAGFEAALRLTQRGTQLPLLLE
jgi:hypothetical protein